VTLLTFADEAAAIMLQPGASLCSPWASNAQDRTPAQQGLDGRGKAMRNENEFANRMKWLRAGLAGIGTLALAGCAHSDPLVPVAGTATIQGPGQTAAGENAGVRMVAREQTWNGDPPTLSQYVLPIWIQLENHSGKGLWLRYSALWIEGPDGGQVTLSAVPPSKVKGNAVIPVSAVGPEFRPADPWLGSWLEPDFDQYLANAAWKERLPTREKASWRTGERLRASSISKR
jgi:hypothetical protein